MTSLCSGFINSVLSLPSLSQPTSPFAKFASASNHRFASPGGGGGSNNIVDVGISGSAGSGVGGGGIGIESDGSKVIGSGIRNEGTADSIGRSPDMKNGLEHGKARCQQQIDYLAQQQQNYQQKQQSQLDACEELGSRRVVKSPPRGDLSAQSSSPSLPPPPLPPLPAPCRPSPPGR